jgi:hypothetical protein
MPRPIPTSVRLTLLFGGLLNQIGYGVFCFGMIFFWVFAGNSELRHWRYFHGPLQTAAGQITAIRKTNFTIGARKGRSGTPVYAHDYSFALNDRTFAGTSYTTGTTHRASDKVTIEFPATDPTHSRIVGMRSAMMPLAMALIGLMPLPGLVLAMVGFVKGRKAIDLLANGQITGAKLIDQRPTNARVNNQIVYAFTFEFQANDGQSYQTVVKTHRTEKLTDEEREMLLYDRANPARAILFDSLPGRVTLNENGGFDPTSAASLYMLLPSLALFGNLAYFMLR